jgi:hypothetical protein
MKKYNVYYIKCKVGLRYWVESEANNIELRGKIVYSLYYKSKVEGIEANSIN